MIFYKRFLFFFKLSSSLIPTSFHLFFMTALTSLIIHISFVCVVRFATAFYTESLKYWESKSKWSQKFDDFANIKQMMTNWDCSSDDLTYLFGRTYRQCIFTVKLRSCKLPSFYLFVLVWCQTVFCCVAISHGLQLLKIITVQFKLLKFGFFFFSFGAESGKIFNIQCKIWLDAKLEDFCYRFFLQNFFSVSCSVFRSIAWNFLRIETLFFLFNHFQCRRFV